MNFPQRIDSRIQRISVIICIIAVQQVASVADQSYFGSSRTGIDPKIAAAFLCRKISALYDVAVMLLKEHLVFLFILE